MNLWDYIMAQRVNRWSKGDRLGQAVNDAEKGTNLRRYLAALDSTVGAAEQSYPVDATEAFRAGLFNIATQGMYDEASGEAGTYKQLMTMPPVLDDLRVAYESGDAQRAANVMRDMRMASEIRERALDEAYRNKHAALKEAHPWAYSSGELAGLAGWIFSGLGPAALAGRTACVAGETFPVMRQAAMGLRKKLALKARHLGPRAIRALRFGKKTAPASFDSATYAYLSGTDERLTDAAKAYGMSTALSPIAARAVHAGEKAVAAAARELAPDALKKALLKRRDFLAEHGEASVAAVLENALQSKLARKAETLAKVAVKKAIGKAVKGKKKKRQRVVSSLKENLLTARY